MGRYKGRELNGPCGLRRAPTGRHEGCRLYSAVFINDDGADFGPIDVLEALNNTDAKEIGVKRATKWLLENEFDHVFLQIVNNGSGLPQIKAHL